MHHFLHGAGYLARGLKQLFIPGIRRWVWLPILTSLAICGGLFLLALTQVDTWLDAWLAGLPEWLAFLHEVLWFAAMLVTVLVLALGFSLLANLVAAPFNGLLAEALIRQQAPACLPAEPPSLGQLIGRSFVRELCKFGWLLRRLLLLGVLGLALLLISWVPGVNLAAGTAFNILLFVFAAWAMSVEYCDYPLDATGQPLASLNGWLRQHRARSLGLGTITAAAAMIPLLNILVMPAAVCGATLMWLEQDRNALPAPDKPSDTGH